MPLIDIEYIHPDRETVDEGVRRTTAEMVQYIRDLMFDMQMGDIDCRFRETVSDGKSAVLINGRSIPEIIDGLKIKMLDSEDDDATVKNGVVTFGRPVLDWNRDHVEDVPDTIMKNAIAKVFADENRNRIDVLDV